MLTTFKKVMIFKTCLSMLLKPEQQNSVTFYYKKKIKYIKH